MIYITYIISSSQILLGRTNVYQRTMCTRYSHTHTHTHTPTRALTPRMDDAIHCFELGVVAAGVIAPGSKFSHCQGGPVRNGQWFRLSVKVTTYTTIISHIILFANTI